MKFLKWLVQVTFVTLVISVPAQFVIPVVAGCWYSGCGERVAEQVWLDRAIVHLKVMRLRCTDPDLQGVLDYTIQRYNRIGAWNVMVMPLGPSFTGNWKVIGCNCPWVPGITLDPEVITYPIRDGSLVLVHEALHDYWPCLGHAHVTPRMEKLEALSWRVL